jgi:hypothetical protein
MAAAIPAAARPAALFAKPGADGAATDAEIKACGVEAQKVRAHYNMPVATSLNPYAMLGTALAAGFIAGYEQGKARNAAVVACMRGKGFGNVELTPQEEAEVKGLKIEARAGWREAWLKSDGLAGRVETALTPAVPQLAPAADEPLVLGGVRFDPARLSVAPAPVGLNAPLLTGSIAHRKTATLAQPLDLPIAPKAHADAGAVFHQLTSGEDTAWCGELASKPLLTGVQHDTYCITTEFDGYHLAFGGKPWLAANQTTSPLLVARQGRLELTESPTDLVGPMQLVLQATRFTKTGVALEAMAFRDGEKVVFWHGGVALDADGHGALPFWTHRLQLQKTGKTLTASLTPDGDGRGWDDLDAPKAQVAAEPKAGPAG